MSRWRQLPALLFALFAFAVIAKPLFAGHTIGAFDQIHQMAPWNGPKAEQPWDVLQADSVLQFYPWRDLVFDAWHSRQLPLWNPYQFCGTPLLANSQSAGFYPPHILMGLLGVPTAIAILILAWFHLFWASLGTYSLSRRMGAGKTGATIAGLSFGGSTFMLAWLALPSVVSTVAWVPWVLSLGLALYEGGQTLLLKKAAMCGFAVGMMLLAGHLQIAAYGIMGLFVALIAMAGLKYKEPGSWRRWGTGMAAIALGASLAAPQLLPVMRYSKLSHRQNVPTQAGYNAYIASAIPVGEFVGRLANPFAYGIPTENATDVLQITSYWPAVSRSRQGDNFAETASTVGPVVIALLLMAGTAAIVSRLRVRPLEEDDEEIDWPSHHPLISVGIAGVLSMLLAVGTPLNALLYYWLPGWSATGSPGRAVYLFVLICCAAAGLAVKDYSGVAPKVRNWVALGAFVAMAATISIAISATGTVPDGIQTDVWTLMTKAANSWNKLAILLVPTVGVVAVYLLKPKTKSGVAVLACIPTLGLLAANIVRSGDPSFLTKPIAPNYGRHAYANDAWDPLNAANAVMPPNTASAMRVHDVAGYDSLVSMQTVQWLKDMLGQDPAPPANGNIMFVKPSVDLAKLGDAGVSSLDMVDRPAQPVATRGRAYTPKGPAEFVEDGFDRLSLRAQGPGKLVVCDTKLPGWSVKVDGKPAKITGQTWREVDLSDGRHDVEFKYVPPGLISGAIIGAAGWALFLGATLVFLPRKKTS